MLNNGQKVFALIVREYNIALSEHKRDPSIPKPKRPKADPNHYAHEQVKTALIEMFGSKCAYCESEVRAVSWQHVEHYRPQSRYPALSYKWENLLLACGRCNQKPYKADKFPIEPAGNTPKENRKRPESRTGADEIPLLINPCDTQEECITFRPEEHITFKNGRVVALTRKGKFSRKIYGLNQDDLVRVRKQRWMLINVIAEDYLYAIHENDHAKISKLGSILRDCVNRYSPFAGMVRCELERMGIDWQNL